VTKEEARKLYLEMLERTKDIELPDGLLVGSPTEELKSFEDLESEDLEEWK